VSTPLATTVASDPRPKRGGSSDDDFGYRELIAIREIAQAFLSAQHPGDVYQFALDRVSRLVGATLSCVYLIDDDSEIMRLRAAHNWPEKYARFLGDMRVRLGHGPSGEAAGERRVIEVADVFADASLAEWRDVANELGFKSLVALPLQTADGVLGAVTFYFAGSDALTMESRGLLRVVADQLAACAEKTRFIEELTRANAELEKQYVAVVEARKLQDEFLSNVSHELRTPLTAVLGYLSLIEEGLAGPVTPEQVTTLGDVKGASEKLLGLIGDLLELTELKRNQLGIDVTEFDPRDALRDAIAATSGRRANVTLTVEEAPALPMISSDRKKVMRLVSALLANAFKFTETGEVRVAIERSSDRIAYRIADTGCGISEEAQRFVFDEFRQEDGSATRKYGGSGLGLAIARRLARLLGGDVTLSSEQGRGSTFRAELPVSYKL
jgi:signal transduction histidine kinase